MELKCKSELSYDQTGLMCWEQGQGLIHAFELCKLIKTVSRSMAQALCVVQTLICWGEKCRPLLVKLFNFMTKI